MMRIFIVLIYMLCVNCDTRKKQKIITISDNKKIENILFLDKMMVGETVRFDLS